MVLPTTQCPQPDTLYSTYNIESNNSSIFQLQTKLEWTHISLFLKSTVQTLDILRKISIRSLKWERRGRLARDIEIRGTTWPWIPWVSFLLTYPRLGAREYSNTEIPMDKGQKYMPQKPDFSSQRARKGQPSKTEYFYIINTYSSKTPRKRIYLHHHQQRSSRKPISHLYRFLAVMSPPLSRVMSKIKKGRRMGILDFYPHPEAVRHLSPLLAQGGVS